MHTLVFAIVAQIAKVNLMRLFVGTVGTAVGTIAFFVGTVGTA